MKKKKPAARFEVKYFLTLPLIVLITCLGCQTGNLKPGERTPKPMTSDAPKAEKKDTPTPNKPQIKMAERPGLRAHFMLSYGLESNMVMVDLPETMGAQNNRMIFSPVMAMPTTEERTVSNGVWQYRAKTAAAEVLTRWSYSDNLASMSLTVTNTSNQTYEDLRAAVCVQAAAAQSFRDTTRERVWVFSDGKKLSWAEIGKRDGFVSHSCLVKDMPQPPGRTPGSGDKSFSLSQVSNILVDDPVICMSSPNGHLSMGTVWQGSTAVFNNNMACLCCMHSDPTFGNVKPGETVTRQGWILAIEGTPEEAHEQLLRLLNGDKAK